MDKPYTIKLFVPDGNPDRCKILNKMNWTGTGLEVSRDAFSTFNDREEFQQAGVYMLYGVTESDDSTSELEESDDRPTVYIGQADVVGERLKSHLENKDFWDRAIIFVSSNKGLNRAHITWLEWSLIKTAAAYKRCKLDNSQNPKEPRLIESEKADTTEFLNEILSILPLIDVRVFQEPQKIEVYKEPQAASVRSTTKDTIVIPAWEDGFQETFLEQNCWYAIRISGGKLGEIKYIAAYRVSPISAVTHVAEIEFIEPYGDKGKYKVNFVAPAREIAPVRYEVGDSAPQNIRYTNYNRLFSAKNLTELFD